MVQSEVSDKFWDFGKLREFRKSFGVSELVSGFGTSFDSYIETPNFRKSTMRLTVFTSDAVGTVPINWPGYNELRLRLRQKPYESHDAVNGVNAVTFYCGQC